MKNNILPVVDDSLNGLFLEKLDLNCDITEVWTPKDFVVWSFQIELVFLYNNQKCKLYKIGRYFK